MKKTLVFGASLKPNRYSYIAVKRLKSADEEVFAFGLKRGSIQGVNVENEVPKIINLHTVTLYLSAKNQQEYYQQIIDLKPKRVIFNPGAENPEFSRLLINAGIEVEDACTLVLLSTATY
ncbi:MAG: CoA-binding protein [Flavobacteriaceae bacterium]|nr:CoA-binding protein [Flavobacteriaceae bacterium]